MLDRLSSQVYFSRVYIFYLLVYFSWISLERLASQVYILVKSILSRKRKRLPLRVHFLILHPRFVSLFQFSIKQYTGKQLGRYTVTIGLICISRVYSLYRERKTCLACLFFEPTPSLSESILVESKTRPRKIHSNAWTNIYYLGQLSIERERLASLVYFLSLHPRFVIQLHFSRK